MHAPFDGHGAVDGRMWQMAMRWRRLLFMHWPVDPAWLRGTLPPAVAPHLDTHDGQAWLGVVPFVMSGMRHRFAPPIPVCGLAGFPELNLRTYLNVNGRRGVWFFSLDAHSRIGVRVARRLFHLPYFDAHMAAEAIGSGTHFRSERTHRGAAPAHVAATYEPIGPVAPAAADTLDHFLTERYCLFAVDGRGRRWRGDIDHAPWPLQPARADVRTLDMTSLLGPDAPDLDPAEARLAYADDLPVRAWLPIRDDV